MRAFFGFSAGLLFGIGLILSGMADPAKVLNFLDVAGSWDPSLALVMAGASTTAFIGFRIAWRQDRPALMADFQVPSSTRIDARLLGGSAIFGVGWGIGGFCPGPAWASLLLGASGTLVFVPAMLIGIAVGRAFTSSGLSLRGTDS